MRTQYSVLGWGAWELAARYEAFAADQDLLSAGSATGTSDTQATTLGVNWYPNAHVKIVANLEHVEFRDTVMVGKQPIDSEDVAMLRVQYSL